MVLFIQPSAISAPFLLNIIFIRRCLYSMFWLIQLQLGLLFIVLLFLFVMQQNLDVLWNIVLAQSINGRPNALMHWGLFSLEIVCVFIHRLNMFIKCESRKCCFFVVWFLFHSSNTQCRSCFLFCNLVGVINCVIHVFVYG